MVVKAAAFAAIAAIHQLKFNDFNNHNIIIRFAALHYIIYNLKQPGEILKYFIYYSNHTARHVVCRRFKLSRRNAVIARRCPLDGVEHSALRAYRVNELRVMVS
jgi:hypothetical protein